MLSEEKIKKIDEISRLKPEEQQKALQDFLKTLSKDEIEFLKGQQACVFCGIAGKQIKSAIIYEDDYYIAVLEINPASPWHTILIPKGHVEFYWQLDNKADEIIKIISRTLLEVLKAEGLSIMIANGQAAGQLGKHIAIHLIPRYKDDGIKFVYQARKMSADELNKIAEKIAGRILENKPKKEMGNKKEEYIIDDSDYVDERIP